MHIRHPETGKVTPWGAVATTASALTLATGAFGCSASREQSAAPAVNSSADGTEVYPSVPIRQEVGRSGMQWPGKVAVANQCADWSQGITLATPVTQDGQRGLLTVINATNSAPQQCDPARDTGASLHELPTVASPAVDLPEGKPYKAVGGGEFVANGTVVRINFYALGQRACQTGAVVNTNTWVNVQATPEGPAGWVAASNLDPGSVPSTEQFAGAGILKQQFPGLFQTSQGGCN